MVNFTNSMMQVSTIRLTRYVGAVLLCLLVGNAYGQRYPFHNLNVDDGLVQSQAVCLTQDKTGNLWTGTLGGLSRYDGRNFTNYTMRDGLLNNMVMGLAADTAGNIWIGTSEGLSKYNGKTFVHYKLTGPNEYGVNTSQQITIIRDTVWWRRSGYIYYVAAGKLNKFSAPGSAGFITAMLLEPGSMFIARADTLYHLGNGKWETLSFSLAVDQKAPKVQSIFRDKDGNIWLATNGGLYKLSNNHIVPVEINGQPLTYPAMVSITQDRAGALWIGTNNSGVIKVSGNSFQNYNKRNGLSDNTFLSMLTDAEGNVWMASDGQGIFRFSGTLFTGLDESMGLANAQVMSITSNRRDSLFLATYVAGLFIFKDGKVTPLPFPSDPVPGLTSLAYTHSRRLWIGTNRRGLWEYHSNIFRQFTNVDHHLVSNFITALYEDPAGCLWIGFDNGVMQYVHDSFKVVATQTGSVTGFLSIGADSVLIATESGTKIYNAGTVVPYITHSIADSSQVQCFTLVGRSIWMGSNDNGIIRYNMDTHHAITINKRDGLRSDFIYNIIADNDSNIWVGTGFGIHRVTMKGDKPRITFYGKEQGVYGMESNLNAVLKQPDGSIWFGTANGAVRYQPHSVTVSSVPASILLKSVKLAGDNVIEPGYYDSTDSWYNIPYHLRLPYKKNNITFTFQAITLSGDGHLSYRYRMEGIDAPWSDWSATTSVTYSALPPGHYVFHVQCTGGDADQHPELRYSFEIITPFQKTGLFKLIILAACLLLGVVIQYLYNHRKERRQRLLEQLRAQEQAKIRLRTAEDFHDEIGNKLTRINVLTNVLKGKITPTPDVTRILGQIEENAGLLYGGTRDILWSLKPSNDNLYEILMRISDFGTELFEDTNINLTFSGISEKWRSHKLQMDMSRNLIMIFKEALNNILKYSAAKNVTIDITQKSKDVMQIILKDDGVGFDPKSVTKGNGIHNMTMRAGRLNGKLYIDSRPGKGTIMSLTFKIPRNR